MRTRSAHLLAAAGILVGAVGIVIAGPAGTSYATTPLYAAAGGSGTSCTQSLPCSLTQAISDANSTGGTIELVTAGVEGDPTTYYQGTYTVEDSSSSPLTLEAAPGLVTAPILDGGGASNPVIFDLGFTQPLNIDGLTIQNGGSGAITAEALGSGYLNISDSTITGNTASNGSAVNADDMTISITDSTITDNTATNSFQGATLYLNYGTLTVSESTIEGNSETQPGMASVLWQLSAQATATFVADTIDSNKGSEVFHNQYSGSANHIYLQGNEIAANSAYTGAYGGACAGQASQLTDNGYNAIDETNAISGCGLTASTDNVGSSATGDLEALADNGGPTETQALGSDNPGVGLIPVSSGDCPASDQRGIAAPTSGSCDAGAVYLESQSVSLPGPSSVTGNTTLSATATSGLPVTYTSATPGVCTVSSSGSLSAITSGSCTIDANQAGDGYWTAAAQVQLTLQVNLPSSAPTPSPTAQSTPAPSAVQVRISPSVWNPRTGAPFELGVSVRAGSGVPSGTVALYKGSRRLGVARLHITGTHRASATFWVSGIGAPAHFRAVYSGSAGFAAGAKTLTLTPASGTWVVIERSQSLWAIATSYDPRLLTAKQVVDYLKVVEAENAGVLGAHPDVIYAGERIWLPAP